MNTSQNIIITGASSGIGFEITKSLASLNHQVFAVSRNIKPINDFITSNNITNIKPVPFDLESEDFSSLGSFINETKIHHLINNAGLLINKPFENLSFNDFKRQYEVNVFSVFKLIKFLNLNFINNQTTICNITSMGGINGTSKFPGLLGYSSSKGALSIFTECLAEEFKERGINVNGLALGAVQTEMLEKAFPGYIANVSPKEMAEFIINFVLKDSKLFNGKILPISSSTP